MKEKINSFSGIKTEVEDIVIQEGDESDEENDDLLETNEVAEANRLS